VTREELDNLIRRTDPVDFCSNYLLDDSAWIFNPESGVPIRGDYNKFRQHMAAAINVSREDIFIVGSAKYGFSLTPNREKYLSSFHADSDLDVLIISRELFTGVWDAFLSAYYSGYNHILDRHRNEIFRRFFVLMSEERYSGSIYLRSICKSVDSMRKSAGVAFGISSPINYRIYASKDDAVQYHAMGMEKIQRGENGFN